MLLQFLTKTLPFFINKSVPLFLTRQVLYLDNSEYKIKALGIMNLGLAVSPFAFLLDALNNYFITEKGYLYFIGGAIVADHVLGTIIHMFYKKDFSLEANLKGILKKTGLLLIGMFIFEGIHFIFREQNFLVDYLKLTSRIMIFLYPGWSAIKNMHFISNGQFPPIGFMNRLDRFSKNLNTKEFTENDPSNPTNKNAQAQPYNPQPAQVPQPQPVPVPIELPEVDPQQQGQ